MLNAVSKSININGRRSLLFQLIRYRPHKGFFFKEITPIEGLFVQCFTFLLDYPYYPYINM